MADQRDSRPARMPMNALGKPIYSPGQVRCWLEAPTARSSQSARLTLTI